MAATDSYYNGFCKYVSSEEIIKLYETGKILGKGGFGRVLKATHLSTGKEVAVKIIGKNILSTASRRNNLVREVNVLRQLKHDHILELHEVLLDEENVRIFTELCEGGDLFY